MSEIFDVEAWRQVLVDSFSTLATTVAGFLPNLAAAIVILAVGFLLSRSVQAVVERICRRLGLDRAAARLRVGETLREAGLEATPSWILARLVFWVLMLTFVLSSVVSSSSSAPFMSEIRSRSMDGLRVSLMPSRSPSTRRSSVCASPSLDIEKFVR